MKRLIVSFFAALTMVAAINIVSDLIWDGVSITYAIPADGVGDSPYVP